MSKPTPRLAGAVALLTVASALAACGSQASAADAPLASLSPSGTSHPEWSKYSFTIGDNGGDGTQELASLTGAFASAPYQVKFARFTYGPPLVQAAASGDIDLGSVGDVPPITGAAQEYGFSIVAVARALKSTQAEENIIVPKGSPIHSLADLKGKKIAVPEGSSAHGLVLNALKSAGLTTKDVQIVFLDPAAGATAFQTGKVDAWAIWNPQSAIAIEHGARVIAKGLPPLDQTSSYYVANDKALKDPTERAALRDVLERIGAEFHYAIQHPAVYAEAISKEEGISLADAKTTVESFENRITPVEKSDITAEQNLSDAFLSADQITKKVDVSSITDNLLPAGYDSSKLH